MLVRFWGTPGSVPTSPDTAVLQDRLRQVLQAAGNKTFANDDDIDPFIETELPFFVSHTFGGNSSCVEI